MSLNYKGVTMLYCCSCYIQAERKLKLYDNTKHKNRVLEIAKCPKCGALKVHIIQSRIDDGKVVEKKPKNSKEVKKFIKQFEKEAYYETPNLTIRYGTKSKMSWTYADGARSKWVKDLNEVRQFKLTKECRVVK